MNIFFRSISLCILLYSIPDAICIASDLVPGPFTVGFESYKTHDNSRLYCSGEDSIPRPLLIHLWYPSEDMNTGSTLDFKHYIDLISQRENYAKLTSEIDENSFNYVHAYSEFAKINLGLDTSIHVQDILDSPVYAKRGIPIQKIVSGSPLLIYAPSNSKSSVQNHMICEYLASYGFIILSVASAGPTSIQRENIQESTMAQVLDMEYILKYCEDSLHIKYSKLGLIGFSSGGNANTIFQMRNKSTDAVFSMDGGQEYGAYVALNRMRDFNLKKADVPYCCVVNNYVDFSIYPLFGSVNTSEKYLFQMPFLNHNGFISHWRFFESCSSRTLESPGSISYDYICACALVFFSQYLMTASSLKWEPFLGEMDKEYIRPLNLNNTAMATLCNTLLNEHLDSAVSYMHTHEAELFADETQVNILARMFIDGNIDLAIFLGMNNVDKHPDSWKAHYNLAYMFKEKGETALSKNSLLKAKALNPDNAEIVDLLKEVNKMESNQ